MALVAELALKRGSTIFRKEGRMFRYLKSVRRDLIHQNFAYVRMPCYSHKCSNSLKSCYCFKMQLYYLQNLLGCRARLRPDACSCIHARCHQSPSSIFTSLCNASTSSCPRMDCPLYLASNSHISNVILDGSAHLHTFPHFDGTMKSVWCSSVNLIKLLPE